MVHSVLRRYRRRRHFIILSIGTVDEKKKSDASTTILRPLKSHYSLLPQYVSPSAVLVSISESDSESENAPFNFVFITRKPSVVSLFFRCTEVLLKILPSSPSVHVPSPGGVVNLEVLLVGVLLRAFLESNHSLETIQIPLLAILSTAWRRS